VEGGRGRICPRVVVVSVCFVSVFVAVVFLFCLAFCCVVVCACLYALTPYKALVAAAAPAAVVAPVTLRLSPLHIRTHSHTHTYLNHLALSSGAQVAVAPAAAAVLPQPQTALEDPLAPWSGDALAEPFNPRRHRSVAVLEALANELSARHAQEAGNCLCRLVSVRTFFSYFFLFVDGRCPSFCYWYSSN
jgi:hypothetical protein